MTIERVIIIVLTTFLIISIVTGRSWLNQFDLCLTSWRATEHEHFGQVCVCENMLNVKDLKDHLQQEHPPKHGSND